MQGIAATVARAAEGSWEVSDKIGGVNHAAGEADHSASQVPLSAGELAQQSEA